MANLLETLLQNPVTPDEKKRLSITRRPFPQRPRDLFELFAAMRTTASMEGLLRGVDLRQADPATAVFAVLGRWPTPQERAALPDPYRPAQHLRQLVLSDEFRARLAARLFAAFPEKRRVLFVRLPRCAGQRMLDAIAALHPLVPFGLEDRKYRDPTVLVKLLGGIAGLFETTSTLAVALPRLAPFVATGAGDASPLRWRNAEPACRTGDLLFTVLRPPRDLALSQVNAALAALRAGDTAALPPHVQARLGTLPAPGNIAAWRGLGLEVLPDIVTRNPVCHALGDGTAASAMAICASVPIQLVGLARLDEWARVALGPAEPPKYIAAAPILRPDDLPAGARETLDSLTAEDRDLYYRFESKFAAGTLPSVWGSALVEEK
jgi:hypothetical protein